MKTTKNLFKLLVAFILFVTISSCRNDNSDDKTLGNKQQISFTTSLTAGSPLSFTYLADFKGKTLDIDWGDGKFVTETVEQYAPDPGVIDYKISGKTKGSTLRIRAEKQHDYLQFSLQNMQITSVDLSKIPELTTLNVRGNLIQSIDFSKNKRFNVLNIYDNPITAQGIEQIANTLPTGDPSQSPFIMVSKSLPISDKVKNTFASKNFRIELW